MHVLVHVCASWDAWGLPRECLVSAMHGIDARSKQSMQHTWVQTKKVDKSKHDKNYTLGTHLSSKQTQKCHWDILSSTLNATVHNNDGKCMNVVKICLNTCLNCHKGPTQMHKHQMGLSPTKKLKKFSQKTRTPTHFRKIPNFENPN